MLLCFLLFIYITWLSDGWGRITCRLLYKTGAAAGVEWQHSLWLRALTGLCSICFIATALSLVIPLGGWLVQLLFAVPALAISFLERKSYYRLKDAFPAKWYFLLLLSGCVALILVMHAWIINHPDTLGYHAEAIAWINHYKAVPGLVHTNDRLGLGSGWFVLCSLFSFSFLHIQALSFINASVLIWAAAFIVQKADHFWGQKLWLLLPCLLLLAFSLCCYTQLRLTATSASPDYVASLLILAVVHTALTGPSSPRHLLLLGVTAVCIKLSAIPVLLIPVSIFFLESFPLFSIKKTALFLLTGFMLMLPLVTRNIITSGYIFYPQPGLQIGPGRNAPPPRFVQLQRDYIKAYARISLDADPGQVAAVLKMPLQEWVPVWWRNRSLADKMMLLLALLSLAAFCVKPVKIFKRANFRTRICLVSLLAGSVFWALTAPDPRFGNGFLLGFSAIVWLCLVKEGQMAGRFLRYAAGLLTALLIAGIFGYAAYRVHHFSSTGSVLTPLGTGRPVGLKLPPGTVKA